MGRGVVRRETKGRINIRDRRRREIRAREGLSKQGRARDSCRVYPEACSISSDSGGRRDAVSVHLGGRRRIRGHLRNGHVLSPTSKQSACFCFLVHVLTVELQGEKVIFFFCLEFSFIHNKCAEALSFILRTQEE